MDPFLGDIRIFAGNYAPVGWNFCDGTLLSISGNDALYSLIGTTYGGDGQSTFALPDLRGRVPIHQGTGPGGRGPYVIGETGGAESVTLLTASTPAHTHQLSGTTSDGDNVDPTGKLLGAAPKDFKIFAPSPPTDNQFNAAHVSPSTGGGLPHENRQPYLAINYIIATSGVFPSQG